MPIGKLDQETEKNIDAFGFQWVLAPGGRKRIRRCQRGLTLMRSELKGYSTLFKNIGRCEIEEGELYGVGIALERISCRLRRITELLDQAMSSSDR